MCVVVLVAAVYYSNYVAIRTYFFLIAQLKRQQHSVCLRSLQVMFIFHIILQLRASNSRYIVRASIVYLMWKRQIEGTYNTQRRIERNDVVARIHNNIRFIYIYIQGRHVSRTWFAQHTLRTLTAAKLPNLKMPMTESPICI